MANAEEVGKWFDPFQADAELPIESGAVIRADLASVTGRILGECLAAQRLLSAKRVSLRESAEVDAVDPAKWGQTLGACTALIASAESTGDRNLKRLLRQRQRQVLSGQRVWPDLASVTPSAFLICADHTPTDYGLPPQLYSSPEHRQLAGWNDFSHLVDSLIATVSPSIQPAWLKGQESLRRAVATVIYETFKNTHDHARTEADGAEVPTSVRAIFTRFYPLAETLSAIDELPGDALSAAERYVRGFAPRRVAPGSKSSPANPVSGMLEVSVLDSGPGMAARWLKQAVLGSPPREQANAVVACFSKGHSTSGSVGRGFGLWKVLLSLSQLRGLISIRTNGVHLFRNFGLTPQGGMGFSQEFGERPFPREFFYDWKRGLAAAPSAFPHVRGTVVSFIIPMGME